ncbi:MAG: LysE family transporter [Bacteroidota bacterium]
MKSIKNILVGFLISFIGSIPLGYLNIVGFQIYTKLGMANVIWYLLGVLIIEAVVIYFTLIFANRLANNEKLLKKIELFSIFFMLLLAYIFHSQNSSEDSGQDYLTEYVAYSPFFIGIILSFFNFIQIPFWTGWNLYLVNAKYIDPEKNGKYFYVSGTVLGTFSGMLALILGLDLITQDSESISKLVLSTIIPIIFVVMALYQSYTFYKKYYGFEATKK